MEFLVLLMDSDTPDGYLGKTESDTSGGDRDEEGGSETCHSHRLVIVKRMKKKERSRRRIRARLNGRIVLSAEKNPWREFKSLRGGGVLRGLLR